MRSHAGTGSRRRFAVAFWMERRSYESRELLSLVDDSGETVSLWRFHCLSCDELAVHMGFDILALETKQYKGTGQ
jgi:hypothetical protein